MILNNYINIYITLNIYIYILFWIVLLLYSESCNFSDESINVDYSNFPILPNLKEL